MKHSLIHLSIGVILLSCLSSSIYSQSFTIRSGRWGSPSIWSDGIVPDATSGSITILHDVIVPSDTTIALDEVILRSKVTVERNASLIVKHRKLSTADFTVDGGVLDVLGTVICNDSATFSGTTATNTFFRNSSKYEHRYFNTAGEPPSATWDQHAQLLITGYTMGKSLNSPKWDQSYGDVIYDCPQQRNGTFVEMLGNIKDVKGDFIVRNTGNGILRVTLDKTALTNIHITGKLQIEGQSQVWLSRNASIAVQIDGDFIFQPTVSASSYLTTTGTAQVHVSGDVIVNATAPLRFASAGGGSSSLVIDKNFSFSRGTITALTPGTGRIILNGNAQQMSLFGNLTRGIKVELNSPSTTTIENNSKINDDILVRNGATLALPAGVLTIEGSLTVESGGDVSSHKGTLQLSGRPNQIISLGGDTLQHLTMTKPSGSFVTLVSALNLKGNLVINSAGLTFESGEFLTLLSQSDDGTDDASVGSIPNGSIITGNVTVQRLMTGEGRIYRYLSSPVKTATIADCQDDFPVTGLFANPSTGSGLGTSASMFRYEESLSQGGWMAYPSSGFSWDNLLLPGKGYAAFIRRPATPTIWDVAGELNQQEVTFSVSHTVTGDLLYDGWNLLGNPYACAVDWNNENGWVKQNIANKIVVKDNGMGIFRYWANGVGNLDGGRIAKGQAFWVQTINATPTLSVNEKAKSLLPTPFHRRAVMPLNMLEITLRRDEIEDQTFLHQMSNASYGIDSEDVLKWTNDFLNLALVSDSTALSIMTVDHLACHDTLTLKIFFSKNNDGSWIKSPQGNYTLSARGLGTFADVSVMLYDKYTRTQIDCRGTDYGFSVNQDPESSNESRFQLFINSPSIENAVVMAVDTFRCRTSPPLKVSLTNLQPELTYECVVNNLSTSYFNSRQNYEFVVADSLLFEGTNEIKIRARTACTNEIVNKAIVNILSEMKAPILAIKNNAIVSSASGTYQWYFNDDIIDGATTSVLHPEVAGLYSLRTTNNGCTSTSSIEYFPKDLTLHCFPNPVAHELKIVPASNDSVRAIELMDSSGKLLEMQYKVQDGITTINLNGLPSGSYLLFIRTAKGKSVQKIVHRD